MRAPVSTLNVVCAGCVLFASLESLFAEEAAAWKTDFHAAKERCQSEGKDLFLAFLGSDWSQPCMALRREVLATPKFESGVSEHFVPVELDFPRSIKQSEDVTAQNQRVRVNFGVTRFPSLILADQQGLAYAVIPNQPEISPAQLIAQVNARREQRQERDRLMAEAESLEGLKRAKKLKDALATMNDRIVERFYGKTVDEIIALDEKNTLKMKKSRKSWLVLEKLEKEVHEKAAAGDLSGIVAVIDATIKKEELKGEQKQRTLMLKLGTYGAEQLDQATALLNEIVKIKSDSDVGREAAGLRLRIAQLKKELAGAAESPH